MTDASDKPLDCRAARDELPALLYEDIDAETKRRLERHLGSCQSCRADLEGYRKTMRLLDTWSVDSAGPARPTEGTRVGGRAIVGWLRPVLVGAAAAAIVFALLGLMGSSVRYGDGQLVVTFGGDSGPAKQWAADPEEIAPVFRAVAREEMDARYEELIELLEAGFVEFGRQEEQRRVLLANAVDFRRNEDWRQLITVLKVLTERLDAQTMQTRQAIDDMWARLSINEETTELDQGFNRREES